MKGSKVIHKKTPINRSWVKTNNFIAWRYIPGRLLLSRACLRFYLRIKCKAIL